MGCIYNGICSSLVALYCGDRSQFLLLWWHTLVVHPVDMGVYQNWGCFRILSLSLLPFRCMGGVVWVGISLFCPSEAWEEQSECVRSGPSLLLKRKRGFKEAYITLQPLYRQEERERRRKRRGGEASMARATSVRLTYVCENPKRDYLHGGDPGFFNSYSNDLIMQSQWHSKSAF